MLTKKQKNLLLFINKKLRSSGISPSYEEMKESLNLKSKSGIHRLISALEERGFIKRLAHKARALEVVKLPETASANDIYNSFSPSVIKGGLDDSNPKNKDGSDIPVLGNIAAGTSTGGLTNKRWGRIGDTPIIGAGTYANNETCGVSGTGQGEYFIRGNIAYDVSALMIYRSLTVNDAAGQVIDKLSERGGNGGLIAMDKNGKIAMSFNTEGMYRGYRVNGSESVIEIYSH